MSDNLTIKQIRDGWHNLSQGLQQLFNSGSISEGDHTQAQLVVLVGVVANLLDNIEVLEQKVEVLSANVQNGLPH